MISETIKSECIACVGRVRATFDSMSPEPAAKLATLLERKAPTILNPTWHWAYFNAAIPAKDVGHDGHEKLGHFMPPVPLLRRMWAAGEVQIAHPLRIGTPAERKTTISDVAFKTGKSGELCFVSVKHIVIQDDREALRELQTIVYRERGQPETALRSQDDPVPEGYQTVPDTTLLGYSAITQNGHRIHWDRDFCRDQEGYPGLVVHGPLLATYLADVLVPHPKPTKFSYRATAPVFETSPFKILTKESSATIERSDGVTAMQASISEL